MGRGKQTNKMYISHSEWSNEFGGMSFGGVVKKKETDIFRRLPFFCCALSLQPFQIPMCTNDGTIFELTNIVPYLKKHGKNPVTGEKLESKSLTKLNFYKNANDEFHCPVTYRVFSDHTHIVAIKTTGNVYAYEAVERLNVKAKHWQDLLNDEKFSRKDILTIQDPHDIKNRNLETFWHLKTDGKKLSDLDQEDEDPTKNINATGTTQRALAEVAKKAKENTRNAQQLGKSAPAKPVAAYNAAHYTTGAAAASFTSTAATPVTKNDRALIDEEEFMFKQIKGKGYAKIKTNMGDLNVELYCEQTPRTCYNFIKLAKSGYYDNVSFHRSIKNFMLQGGDPTGTGKGGSSFWKKDFADEIRGSLTHSGRGVMSMANRGKGTNSSQFFFTYRSCTHLDGKHTVFGKIVGGLSILDRMESVPTNEADDRPTQKITITEISVFIDPFDEFNARLQRKLNHQRNEAEAERNPLAPKKKDEKETWFGRKVIEDSSSSAAAGRAQSLSGSVADGGVGKYLSSKRAAESTGQEGGANRSSKTEESTTSILTSTDGAVVGTATAAAAAKKRKMGFGDFDGW